MKRHVQISIIYAAFLILFSAVATIVNAQNDYQKSISQWREKKETDLKSDDGWLTVAGLFWLKEGVNTVGSEPGNDVELPADSAPAKVGFIDFKQGAATLHVNPGVNLTSENRPVTSIELISDDKEKPTLLRLGDVTFNLIKREDRYGIRVKDKNSSNRRNFTGLHWYPINENYLVTARFVPFEKPEAVLIPNVLGGSYKMTSPGLLIFKLNGTEYKLKPVEEGEQLFIIFRDLTSRTTTYGAGRFLYAEKPAGATVTLDFNKAENPPCAFTSFATCPLPPEQNRLNVEIPAGEKRNH